MTRVTFGEKIKALRTERGLTLEQVGDRVGVGKSTVRKWESGQIANMRRDKIALLAKALDVSPGYLMGWDEISEALGSNSPAAQKLRQIGAALSGNESELVDIYRSLNDLGQTALMGTARGLAANPDMKKDGSSNDKTTT